MSRRLAWNLIPAASLYTPYEQRRWPTMSIAVRTMGDPMATAGVIRKQIANLDPELPLTSIRPMEDIVRGLVCAKAPDAVAAGHCRSRSPLPRCAFTDCWSMRWRRRQEMGTRRAARHSVTRAPRRIDAGAGIVVGLTGSLALTACARDAALPSQSDRSGDLGRYGAPVCRCRPHRQLSPGPAGNSHRSPDCDQE
jgi:hypothetical protein